MARKEWELLFNLSAKQNSSFSSTFKAAQSALVETQGKIQLLNKVQSDISAYQKQQQAAAAVRHHPERDSGNRGLLLRAGKQAAFQTSADRQDHGLPEHL